MIIAETLLEKRGSLITWAVERLIGWWVCVVERLFQLLVLPMLIAEKLLEKRAGAAV